MNKKLNKGIFTGLAAVTLFSPMVLHNTQANADNINVSKNTVKSALERDGISNIHFSKVGDDTSGVDVTASNADDKSDNGNYDLGNIQSVTYNGQQNSTQLSVSNSNLDDAVNNNPNKPKASNTTTVPKEVVKSALERDGISNIHFSKVGDDTSGVDVTASNADDKSDNGNYDLGNIQSVTYNGQQNSTQLSVSNSNLDDVINNNPNKPNYTPSGRTYIVSSNTNLNNNNNSNSGYTAPRTNNGSQAVKFPSTPTTKESTHKTTKHSNKVSAKQLKKDKASVKKNQKKLNNIKNELKATKSKSHKAKLNKELKQAKKAFAKSEIQLNHAKHAVK